MTTASKQESLTSTARSSGLHSMTWPLGRAVKELHEVVTSISHNLLKTSASSLLTLAACMRISRQLLGTQKQQQQQQCSIPQNEAER